MPASPLVIGLGHVTCDITVPLQGWPERDQKTIIPGIALSGGGPTANAMAALARLGVNVGLVGKLGTDLLGRYSVEAHAAEGIDLSRLIISDETVSPVSVILVDQAEQTRTILLTKGERTTLDPDELDLDYSSRARVIHLDGHQMPASLAVARAARDWPTTTIVLDAGGMREGMLELCSLCDIVIASARFARELAATDEPLDGLHALLDHGVPCAGVTLGAQGSVLSRGGATLLMPAFPVQVADTTGAGDAFHGGFIYGLVHGMDDASCLRCASAVAAMKCGGLGTRQALPNASQLAEFLSEQDLHAAEIG
jgi:ribokinase